MAATSTQNAKSYVLAFAVTVSLFAIWGLAHRLYGTLVPQFAKFFELGSSQAALVQACFGAAYLVLAIPAGLFLRQFGFKAGVVFGLGTFAVGSFLLHPAVAQHEYLIFLGSVMVMAAGWTLLETSANPMIALIGRPENAVQRLNFAQAFYPVGMLGGVYIGRWLILSNLSLPVAQLAHAIMQPYIGVGLGVLLLAFVVDKLSFPPAATEHDENGPPVRNQLRTLLAQPRVRFGVTALFFYVAAQFGVWTFTTRFVRAAMPELSAMAAADVLLLSWVLYMAGRFAGTVLMYRVKPTLLLAICAGASLFLTACAAGTGGLYGVACLAGTSFFMSIMFPTIFGNTIRDLGPLTKSASALLVTATGGGVTAAAIVMNLAVEFMTVQQIMLVPSLCFAAVLAYTLADRRANKASTSAASDGVSAQ